MSTAATKPLARRLTVIDYDALRDVALNGTTADTTRVLRLIDMGAIVIESGNQRLALTDAGKTAYTAYWTPERIRAQVEAQRASLRRAQAAHDARCEEAADLADARNAALAQVRDLLGDATPEWAREDVHGVVSHSGVSLSGGSGVVTAEELLTLLQAAAAGAASQPIEPPFPLAERFTVGERCVMPGSNGSYPDHSKNRWGYVTEIRRVVETRVREELWVTFDGEEPRAINPDVIAHGDDWRYTDPQAAASQVDAR